MPTSASSAPAGERASRHRRALDHPGEGRAATAVKSLQVHVSQLRQELGDGQPIVMRPTGYAVELAPGALDLERFERHVEDAPRLRAAGDQAGAAEALRAGLELFRGPPLSDVELLGRASTRRPGSTACGWRRSRTGWSSSWRSAATPPPSRSWRRWWSSTRTASASTRT